MDDIGQLCLQLRKRAAHCRALARDALSPGVARELEVIAAEYERDADRLEALARAPTEQSAVA